MAMMRYMVVVEHGETSWGAHVPDLPGCVAVGETREEVLRLIREAIEFHIDGLKQDGLPVPPPSSAGEFVEVGAAELRHGADGLRPPLVPTLDGKGGRPLGDYRRRSLVGGRQRDCRRELSPAWVAVVVRIPAF